ncbi:RHS repeat-associated core domain-containing protein [Xanthomonas sp. NCPPB 2632]|uniref:RHS repeat-associated core domain-containing protein n=1 Tax=Xanthomonas sp. NCPPB 2632 TaxID=3240912 RepID=UPI003512C31E
MSIVRRCLRPGSAWLTALLLFMAMVCASMGVAHAAETITYYYTSPQGTVLAKADASGNIISSADYRPYGTQALGTPEQGPGYTGHVNDVDSGFVYMQARYYDTSVGRFLSADPAASRPADTFSFNRFVYANDNPAINIDPDGKDCTTSNGMTRCVTQSYDVAFRAQPGFVDFKSTSENYHFYSVPLIALGVSVSSARAQLVEFPTPGFSKGASASGTRNDATPVLGGLLSRYISPVMSFTVTNMVDHQPAVVNVTQEGHPLASGIVVREAVPLASGSSLVNTWGEGTSTLQAPGSLTGPIINSIWEEEGPKDYKIPFSD